MNAVETIMLLESFVRSCGKASTFLTLKCVLFNANVKMKSIPLHLLTVLF